MMKNQKQLTVSELIEILKLQPQDLIVWVKGCDSCDAPATSVEVGEQGLLIDRINDCNHFYRDNE